MSHVTSVDPRRSPGLLAPRHPRRVGRPPPGSAARRSRVRCRLAPHPPRRCDPPARGAGTRAHAPSRPVSAPMASTNRSRFNDASPSLGCQRARHVLCPHPVTGALPRCWVPFRIQLVSAYDPHLALAACDHARAPQTIERRVLGVEQDFGFAVGSFPSCRTVRTRRRRTVYPDPDRLPVSRASRPGSG